MISNSPQSSNVTPAIKRSRRKTKPVDIQLDNSSVSNFSSYSLSTNETSILSRGLTFCIRGKGNSNIKKVGVLVVSLRGVNFRFWSRLGC